MLTDAAAIRELLESLAASVCNERGGLADVKAKIGGIVGISMDEKDVVRVTSRAKSGKFSRGILGEMRGFVPDC